MSMNLAQGDGDTLSTSERSVWDGGNNRGNGGRRKCGGIMKVRCISFSLTSFILKWASDDVNQFRATLFSKPLPLNVSMAEVSSGSLDLPDASL